MPNVRTLFFSLFSLCLLCPPALAQTQAAPTATVQAERTTVVASAAGDRVRFAAPNRVARLRLEVLSPSGDVLFESSSRGSVLDWTLSDAQGNRLADGSYLCVVTAKDVAGRMTQRLTIVEIANGAAAARAAIASDLTARQAETVGPVEAEAAEVTAETEAPAATLLAHDGRDGQLVTTAGDLSFRGGDFFTGQDKELMRLSADGSLDIAGALTARGGIRFADGTVLTSAGSLGLARTGKGAKAAADGGGTASPSAAGTGTLNRLAKWTETGGAGTLGDSAITDVNGLVGVGNASPTQRLDVAGNTRFTAPAGSWALGTAHHLFVSDDGSPVGFQNTRSDAGAGAHMFDHTGVLRAFFQWHNPGVPNPNSMNFATAQNDPIHFATNTFSARMTITGPGDVGIGTMNPTQRLEVVGNLKLTGATNGLIFPDGTKMTTAAGGGLSGSGSANTVPLWTGATTLGNSVVTQFGTNVGIGTGAPAAKLEVVGGASGGVAASSTGGFALFGSNPAGWAVGAEGNTRQSRDRGGWVKAMIYVDQTGAITRCFNSFEPDGGASLAGCGFTVTHPGAGVYTVSFPFAVNDRFYSLAAKSASTTESPRINTGANFEPDVNPNSLVVSTFLIDAAGNQTADAAFMLVIY